MEGDLQTSPHLGYSIDNDDGKYFSGLSTIMVATIQEVKDRISQIEYIFCSQLFPNFQSRSKSFHKSFTDTWKAAEDEWRKKEHSLLLQIEEFSLEKQHALEQIQHLNASLEQASLKQEKTTSMNNGRQLNVHEKEKNSLLTKLKDLEVNVYELQYQLKQKNDELAEVGRTQEKLHQIVESKSGELLDLMEKLKGMEVNVNGLQKELKQKTEEAAEGRKLEEKLLQEIRMKASEILNTNQLLSEHENTKKLLLNKLEILELNVGELRYELKQKAEEVAEGKKLQEKYHQKAELNASEILIEKRKTREAIVRYRRLTSQYNYLLQKVDLTKDNMLPHNRTEGETNSSRLHQNLTIWQDPENKDPETTGLASKISKQKNDISFQEKLEADGGASLSRNSSSPSPSTSSSPYAMKCPISEQSKPLSGKKREVSYWRVTRSRQEPGGPDPHDDFLDTPMENAKRNLNKLMKDEVHNIPGPTPKDMDFESSDDETQDINADPAAQKKQISIPMPEVRSFKYVEPVRKKAERENLKGIECKQCKKFYDAVLPDGRGKDSDNENRNFRCEHHDGVSRHRYKYAPPMTPEGFWNIGFDSDV